MADETPTLPRGTDRTPEGHTDDTGAREPALRAKREIAPSSAARRRAAVTLAVAALVLLSLVSIVWMARPDTSGAGKQKPLVALTKRDWLLLTPDAREGAVYRALRVQCNGTNIDAQARLVTQLVDAAYAHGSTDTPVKQVIEYLDTASLVCWGSIGGTK